MAYRMVYLRIRSSGYNFGWTSDADQAAFKEESRRIFQKLGWTLHAGRNGVYDTVTNGYQDTRRTALCSFMRANACARRWPGSWSGGLLVLPDSFRLGVVVMLPLIPVKGGGTMDRNGQKPQVNMFRRRRRQAPFPMKRGFSTPGRREFRRRTHSWRR